jgi:hypothetical protein
MALIQSGATSDLLTIDPTSKAARVSMYDPSGNPMVVTDGMNATGTQGGFPMAGTSDNTYRVMRTDRIGSVRTGNDSMLLHDDMEGTTLNSWLWTTSLSTMTVTQAGNSGILFNAGASVASGVYAILTSQKQFIKMQASPLRARFRVKFVPTTNTIAEMGFCLPVAATGQISTGVFFRATTTGTIVPVIAYNGADVVQGTDMSTAIGAISGGFNNYFTCGIWVDDDNILFTVQDVATGYTVAEQTLQIPRNQAKTFSTTHIPFALRLYTTGIPAVAPQVYLSDVMVLGLDILSNKMWAHQLAGTSNGGEILPTTFAQASNYANSTVAANATLSNTAAGYTTLGGLFSFVAPVGAVTDFALFGFTVPAPYTFYCTGIHITSYNTGAAVATTSSLLHWSVANNSSAVSLATAGLARTTLGAQSFPIAAAIGATATDLDVQFQTPLITNGGRILHVIVRVPVGTATASQVIQGSVMINGYFE